MTMNLTEGGVTGVLSALKYAVKDLEEAESSFQSDEARGLFVEHLITNMNDTIQERIQGDQLPGDPTKGE